MPSDYYTCSAEMSSVTLITSALLLVFCTADFSIEHADECASTDHYALVATSQELRKAIRCELDGALEKVSCI